MVLCAICQKDVMDHTETAAIIHLKAVSELLAIMQKAVDDHNCYEKVNEL